MRKFSIFLLFALLGLGQAVAQETDYLPIAREGVKWVNEKVIVNHGDTTHYYYKYEFKGFPVYPDWQDENSDIIFGSNLNACHYYVSSEIDADNDSIIASFSQNGWRVDCYYNWALEKISNEHRNLIKRLFYVSYGETLYFICHEMPELSIKHYIDNQTEPMLLTFENFILASSVDIDGQTCQRYAYVGEEGDTLALIVEGIGFDSRDMGDLLTPFTRQPDPNADYQEWCGLSHVVKDGQIIYKGMRYRPGVLVGLDEAVADRTARPSDPHYYDLMGRPVGKDVPSTPGIYIHNGKKIVVR